MDDRLLQNGLTLSTVFNKNISVESHYRKHLTHTYIIIHLYKGRESQRKSKTLNSADNSTYIPLTHEQERRDCHLWTLVHVQ